MQRSAFVSFAEHHVQILEKSSFAYAHFTTNIMQQNTYTDSQKNTKTTNAQIYSHIIRL